MTHPTREVLLDLALDTLAAPEAAEAQAHLGDCPECAKVSGLLEEEQRVLNQAVAREPALPVGLRASILSAARSPFRKAPRVLLAAAAVVALAAGLALLRPDERRQVMLDQVRESERIALGLEDSE